MLCVPSSVHFSSFVIRWVLIRYCLQYSVNRHGPIMGTREKGWEEITVASLDSALNSWFDSLPDHRGSTLDGAPLLAYRSLSSALGSPTGESNLLRSISSTTHCLLLYSDYDPSTVHTYCPERERFVFSCIRNLCKRCPCFQPCCRCSSEEVPDRYYAKYPRAYSRWLSPSRACAEVSALG